MVIRVRGQVGEKDKKKGLGRSWPIQGRRPEEEEEQRQQQLATAQNIVMDRGPGSSVERAEGVSMESMHNHPTSSPSPHGPDGDSKAGRRSSQCMPDRGEQRRRPPASLAPSGHSHWSFSLVAGLPVLHRWAAPLGAAGGWTGATSPIGYDSGGGVVVGQLLVLVLVLLLLLPLLQVKGDREVGLAQVRSGQVPDDGAALLVSRRENRADSDRQAERRDETSPENGGPTTARRNQLPA